MIETIIEKLNLAVQNGCEVELNWSVKNGFLYMTLSNEKGFYDSVSVDGKKEKDKK